MRRTNGDSWKKLRVGGVFCVIKGPAGCLYCELGKAATCGKMHWGPNPMRLRGPDWTNVATEN